MRERTTWNRSAAQTKVADPYLMNQDHVSQQPGAGDYVIGDPSTFAEDIHPSKDTWEAEYAGGQVKRNEIGMAEMRKDTFSHPEKTAADHGLLLKKADLCIKTASMMLGAAGDAAVEDQAVALMHIPDADLINTYTRLANGQQGQVAMQQQTATQQVQAQAMQAQQCIQAGDVEGAQSCMATMMQQAQECMAQGDVEAAQECLAQVQQVKAAIEAAQQGQAPVAGGMWAGKLAQQKEQAEKEQAAKEQAAQGQQKKQAQQDEQGQGQKAQGQQKKQAESVQAQQVQAQIQTAVQQAVAQAMAAIQAGQDPMAAVQQQAAMHQQSQQAPVAQAQQAAMHQQSQQAPTAFDAQADDLEGLLMEPGLDGGLSEMGIEMEPAPMDVGEMDLGPEDDVLMTLFAADQGEKKEQEPAKEQGQQGQKQAMSRTASTRTVGTRPTQGVSRVGGGLGGNAGGDVNKLAALWPSAPDVSDAFR